MNITTNTITIGYPPSKKDILQRLFQEGHIDFNEMWILLQDEPTVKYVPMPQQIPHQEPWNPFKQPEWSPPQYPYTYTAQDPANDQSHKGFHFGRRGSDASQEP